jgi:murein L,D-transpeptidase YcbB/YkuD
MPRTLGPDYVFVNIPSYQVALFKADTVVATHDVVVGAPKTPTPMLSANVGSIIINPWWTLPPTVLREGKRYSPARGYVYQTIHGKTYVRQKPGPMNALGRVKIEFPNPYAIYLHDTPAKSAFERSDRALSHGCIRVKGIETLAAEIGDPTAVQTALDRRYTQTLSIQLTLPLYIVFYTAAPAAHGTVEMLPDPYGRDAGVVAALDAPNPALPTTAVAAAQPAAVMQGL